MAKCQRLGRFVGFGRYHNKIKEGRNDEAVGTIERFAFYENAKTAYAIIATSEKALYANIMLQKGIILE